MSDEETEVVDTEALEAQLAELTEAIERFESQKRWSDVIKTTLKKADLVPDSTDKVDLLSRAGGLYIERSSNAAEAIKCFERVMELEPNNPEALIQLEALYEKRRDWENLIAIKRKQSELMDSSDRSYALVEMATLASERIRKPAICIELWAEVLENDPDHPEALKALSTLYDRSKDYEKLADVLEKLADQTSDSAELATILTKLGSITGDKLKDDARAVSAYRRLLEIKPDDRRAQEQLKRRFTALKAWDELEEFFSANEKWDDLIRIFERAADDKEASTESRTDLLFRVAELYQDKKGKADRAARAYEKALTIDGENVAAAEALSPIYEAAGDAKKLVRVYEVRIRHLEDPTEKVMLLQETAQLYETKLRDPKTAFERYLQAFKTTPTSDVIREEVARAAQAARGMDRLVEAYGEAVESAAGDERVELQLDFGSVLRNVERKDEAIAAYSAVLDAEPDNATALAALAELYNESGRTEDLLTVFDRRLELESGDQRKQTAYGRAALIRDQLARPDDAVDAYQQILSDFGEGEWDAFDALEDLYEQGEKWQELADTIERRLDQEHDAEVEAALKFRLGRVLELRLDEKARAVELYREVITMNPEHPGVEEALRGLLDDEEVRGAAAAILEPVYEVFDENEKLIRAVRVLHDVSDDPTERRDYMVKVGDIHLQSAQAPQAFDAYGEALVALPSDQDVLARLEALGLEQGRFADLAKITAQLAGSVEDRDLGTELWVRTAAYHDTQLNDVDASVHAYNQVLEEEPENESVLASLEELLRRSERWAELLPVLRRRAAIASSPEDKERYLAQVAFIQDEMLSDSDQAIQAYREILEEDPTSTVALQGLDRLLERGESWPELAENIERQLGLAEDEDTQLSLMYRLATLRESRMGEVETAIDGYREILDRNPNHPEARAALERLIEQDGHQVVIAEILEPLYRDMGDTANLIYVHEVQVRHEESGDRQVELLHRISELYEIGQDDHEAAFKTMGRALGVEPSNTLTIEQLERLAGMTGPEPLAVVYEQRVEGLEDAEVAANLLTRAAEIREEMLADNERAITHYKRVLELDNTRIEAASALERLYHMGERYDELASVYLQKAEMVGGGDEQKELLFRAGAIYEDVLERPVDAITVYRQLLESDPHDTDAMDKLADLHTDRGEWPELLAVYAQKVDVVSDPDEQKHIYTQVGAVYEHQLNDVPKAIETYQRIAEIDPDDRIAVARLDTLFSGTGNDADLLPVLERQAELADEPSEALHHRHRIGDLHHRKLGDVPRAIELFSEILDAQPDHAATITSLEAVIAEGEHAVAAANTLEPVYRQFGEWERLVAVHEVQVRHEEDPYRRVELLHQIAELREVQLEQYAEAFDAYARSLPDESTNDVSRGSLERLATELNRWPEVTALYDAQLPKLTEDSPDAAVELGLRSAKLYEIYLEDTTSAIERYKGVLAIEEQQPDALDSLDRLYEGTGRWQELTSVLATQAEVAPTPDDALEYQFRLGQVYEHQLSDVDNAIEQYRGILAASPEHASSLGALEMLFAQGTQPKAIGEILEPLYQMQGAWDRLCGVHETQLAYEEDQEQRVQMIHRIAEIAEDRGEDHNTAFYWMQRALFEAPTDEKTHDEVERLSTILNGWQQLAHTYSDVLHRTEDVTSRNLLGRKLARVYDEELEDVAGAEAAYRYLVAHGAEDDEVLDALDQVYTANGAHQALSEVLRKRAMRAEDLAERVGHSYRLGRVLERDLGKVDEAILTYRKLLAETEEPHFAAVHSLQAIYARQGDWRNLYDSLERELEGAVGDSNRSDVLAKMALIAGAYLGEQENAIKLWREVLDLRGEDVEALNALGNIYAGQENWRDLVDVLEREALVTNDEEVQKQIFADLARIWYERLERDKNALDNWERVIDIDPGSTDALSQIAGIHRAAGAHQDQADTLNRIISVGAATLDDSALEQVYLELGNLYAGPLEQQTDAIEAYQHAADINTTNFDTMATLEHHLVAQERWEEVVGVKEQRAMALTDPAQRIPELHAIADTWAGPAQQADRGTSAHERVIDLDPLNARSFEKLEELHTGAMRWESLIDMYVARVEQTEDLGEGIELLRKAAKVHEDELHDSDQAFEYLQLAWTQDYSDEVTTKEIERVARGGANNERWNALLNLANAELQEAEDNETKIQICLHCARWYGQELGRLEYAIPYYEEITKMDPNNFAAVRQMGELYRHTQQWQQLAQALGRQVEMTNDVAQKATVYVEMGDLCTEHLGIPDQSFGYYKRALDTDPTHFGALSAMENVYRNQQNWPQLLGILERKAGVEAEPEVMVAAKLQLAQTQEDRAQDYDGAIRSFQGALEIEPTNIDALKGLERLYAHRERWPDLLEVLESQYSLAESERDKVSLLTRIAAMWEEEFVKPAKAAERLEEVLEIEPTNENAHNGLARLYHGMQRWDELLHTYERHVQATPDRAEKGRVLKAIGGLKAGELNDLDGAVDAYLDALSIYEDDVEAIDALSRLYEKRGEHHESLQMMHSLATLSQDPEHQVDLRFRMGRILDEQMGDRVSALDQYMNATDVNPGHLPSLEAMRKIYLDQEEWGSAARILEQEAEHEQNPRLISNHLTLLGQIRETKLDEAGAAVGIYDAALKQNPENEEAALPLSRRFMDMEEYEHALPLLDMLVKRSSKREPHEQHELAGQLGLCASKLGKHDEAAKAYGKAYQIDSNHLPSLMGLADSYYSLNKWDRAFKYHQMLLVHHRDSLSPGDTTETFYKLGVIKREQGERRKALNMFDKALEENPSHAPSLEAMVDLYGAQRQWEQVIHFKKQLLAGSDDEEKRFELLHEIGDLWAEKVGNQPKAIEAYSQASQMRPEDHKLLHKLLGSYQKTKQWAEAIGVIQQISDLDERAAVKAKYAYTIGVIARDELKDPDQALGHFDNALHHDTKQLKAFEAINKILTQRRDWKQLERAFRKMIHRVADDESQKDLQFNLWHNLGVIYRDRLNNYEAAADGFAMASRLQPDNALEHQILAELHAMIPNKLGESIKEHHWLLKNDPYRVESYRALYRLHCDMREYDKAWCVASALTFLQKADTEQQNFYQQYKQEGVIRPRSRIDNERWVKCLFHEDESLYISKMMEAIAPAVLGLKSSTDKALGLSRKHLVDPNSSTATFARTFGFAAQVLNLPIVPRLYLRQDSPGGFTHVTGSNPPAVVCGSGLLSGHTPEQLAFVIGKYLAYYRGEHFIRTLLGTSQELKAVLLGGMRVAGVIPSSPQVDQTAQQLAAKLQPQQVEALRAIAKKMVDAGISPDVKRWMQTSELTACRAGFLVCNDLATAARMIKMLPPEGANDTPMADKIIEIVLFSISERYFQLRELLGIQINV